MVWVPGRAFAGAALWQLRLTSGSSMPLPRLLLPHSLGRGQERFRAHGGLEDCFQSRTSPGYRSRGGGRSCRMMKSRRRKLRHLRTKPLGAGEAHFGNSSTLGYFPLGSFSVPTQGHIVGHSAPRLDSQHAGCTGSWLE